MRTTLREWYPPSEQDERKVLDSGTLVLDSSSLLTLYRLDVGDRKLVLDILDAVKDRLWIPHRVGLEFQRNRLRAYHEQLKAYDDLDTKIRKLSGQMLDSLQAHPVLTQRDIRREIEDRLASLSRYIAEQRTKRHPADLQNLRGQDGVRDGIDKVFDGRVGPPKELSKDLMDEAKRRFAEKVPPGYGDEKKPVPERYGDLLLWLDTLAHLATRPDGSRALLFVTEDMKEDWWLLSPDDGTRIGPRPELVLEARVKGVQPFMMMSLRRFFQRMASHLGWERVDLGEYTPVAEPLGSEAPSQPGLPDQPAEQPQPKDDRGAVKTPNSESKNE